tara:strand:- start:335 stop:1237 length:903 start_codon:yes stop_codon:yes gene_type:complete
MPLENAYGPNYLKVTKLFIDSEDKEPGGTEYNYTIVLKQEIQYVTAMEMTGYNFPSEMAPTFIDESVGDAGNNVLDFTLSAGALTKTFSLKFPQQSYTFENVSVPYLSYIRTLEQLLNAAIFSDVDFGSGGGNEARFRVGSDPFQKTSVTVSGTGITGFSFLYLTGVNSKHSSFLQMGFEKLDYSSTNNSLISPDATSLNPFPFIDINIEEVEELKPFKRIYMEDNALFGTVYNDPDLTRTRLLSSKPIQRLKRLRIKITLKGDQVPPTPTSTPHQFTLTLLNIANEETVPKWCKQTLVL